MGERESGGTDRQREGKAASTITLSFFIYIVIVVICFVFLVGFLHSFHVQMWRNFLTKSQTQKVGCPTSATSAITKR